MIRSPRIRVCSCQVGCVHGLNLCSDHNGCIGRPRGDGRCTRQALQNALIGHPCYRGHVVNHWSECFPTSNMELRHARAFSVRFFAFPSQFRPWQ